MKVVLYFLLIVLMVAGVSCTYSVHQVPISDFRPYADDSKGTPVEGRAKQFVILGFVDQTHYADQAYLDIQNQCKDGVVTGIATKFYTEHGFFSWTNHVVMQGICLRRS